MRKSINGDNDSQDIDSSDLNLPEDQINEFKQAYKETRITAQDIILPPFLDMDQSETDNFTRQRYIEQQLHAFESQSPSANNAQITEESKNADEQINNEISDWKKRIAQTQYDSYLSTPNFIKRICEISDALIGLENKHAFAQE